MNTLIVQGLLSKLIILQGLGSTGGPTPEATPAMGYVTLSDSARYVCVGSDSEVVE